MQHNYPNMTRVINALNLIRYWKFHLHMLMVLIVFNIGETIHWGGGSTLNWWTNKNQYGQSSEFTINHNRPDFKLEFWNFRLIFFCCWKLPFSKEFFCWNFVVSHFAMLEIGDWHCLINEIQLRIKTITIACNMTLSPVVSA